jgi:hypothetical protein
MRMAGSGRARNSGGGKVSGERDERGESAHEKHNAVVCVCECASLCVSPNSLP